jgi:hypothetical protein
MSVLLDPSMPLQMYLIKVGCITLPFKTLLNYFALVSELMSSSFPMVAEFDADMCCLNVEAQDTDCRDKVFWQVVGQRNDDTIKKLSMTDSDGNVIIEPLNSGEIP